MTGVALVTPRVRIQFAGNVANALLIASDDADTVSGGIATDDSDLAYGWIVDSDWTADFSGDEDDVTALVDTITLTAGRDDSLSEMVGGVCSLELRDPEAIFNYLNQAGPLYGLLEDQMHPVRVELARPAVIGERSRARVVDAFEASDVNPLVRTGWANKVISTHNNVKLLGRRLASTGGSSSAYWTDPVGPDSEASVEVTVKPAAGQNVSLFLRITDPGVTAMTSYLFQLIVGAGATDQWRIRRIDAGNVQTNVANVAAGPSLVAGDRIEARAIDSTFELWHYSAATGDSTLIASGVDATYTAAGYAGLSFSDAVGRLDNFATGTPGELESKFYGFTRRIQYHPGHRRGKGHATIDCVDLFYWLQRAKPTIAATGATTTGAAIGLILDSIYWSDPTARNLAVGDSIPDFSADGTKTGIDLIGELLEAERGVFFVNGEGIAVYEDRSARYLRVTSEATFADVMSNIEPEIDFDLIQNRVTVERLDTDGTVLYTAVASDYDSIGRIGVSDADTISTPYVDSNAHADDLADWELGIVRLPISPVRAFELDGRDPWTVDDLLALELVDRITLSESVGDSEGDFHIERKTIIVDAPGRLSASYLVTAAATESLLLIAIDDTDTGVGLIAIDDADTEAGVIIF